MSIVDNHGLSRIIDNILNLFSRKNHTQKQRLTQNLKAKQHRLIHIPRHKLQIFLLLVLQVQKTLLQVGTLLLLRSLWEMIQNSPTLVRQVTCQLGLKQVPNQVIRQKKLVLLQPL
nr:MAG TPA: hypothetical protein [Caudoviricetes sp.]